MIAFRVNMLLALVSISLICDVRVKNCDKLMKDGCKKGSKRFDRPRPACFLPGFLEPHISNALQYTTKVSEEVQKIEDFDSFWLFLSQRL